MPAELLHDPEVTGMIVGGCSSELPVRVVRSVVPVVAVDDTVGTTNVRVVVPEVG